jgi:dienelactone hydrolase
MKPVVWLLAAAAWASIPQAVAAQDAANGAQADATAEAPGDAATPAANERPPLIPARHFAERSQFNGAKLSLDGKLMALTTTVGDKATLAVFDPATKKALGAFPLAADAELDWFRWAGPSKIIVSVSMQGEFFNETVRFTRLALVNVEEKWAEILGRRNAVVEGDNVIFIAKDGSYALVSAQRTVYDYPSVFRYELARDGKISEVQTPREGVWRWYADDAGVVRLGTGWRNNALRYFYREADGAKLRELTDVGEGAVKWPKGQDPKYSSISQILAGSDRGYVMRENEAGRVGLYLFDYARREVIDPVYLNEDWDVESVAMRGGKPFAAFYTSDSQRVVWFDEAQRKLNERLDLALPEEEAWITSRADDDSRMLVWGGGAADPGAIYVYTPGESRLDQFDEMRPKLDFRQLAKPQPVSFKARDGVTINGYLTLPRGRAAKGLPLIVMPHGGPFWVRDTLTYNDEVQLLANRGYAVLQPNFRGSGGYGEDFHKLGAGQIGRKMQDDLDDAMDWLVGQGIADKGRACLVGGSYGGYASIWGLIRNPERWRCAASWAGVTDWARLLRYDRRFLSRNSLREWQGMVEGDGSLELDEVSPYRLAAQLSRPLLLAHGTVDSRVPFSQYKAMRDAAASAPIPPTVLVIDGEGHSFSSIDNEAKWYEALDTFLAKHNPAD